MNAAGGVLALVALGLGVASAEEAEAPSASLHAPYDRLLRAHVRDGAVDYAGLKKREAALDDHLRTLGRTDPDRLSRDGKLAFWINAYNAFTLKLILRHYPNVTSIKEIPNRWDHQEWTVGGKKYSLDQIEHKILRKMDEPRIHFAIVCASKSCPDLAAEAYLPETIDAQLTAATRRFLADGSKGLAVSLESGWFGGRKPVVRLSRIFSWFSEDFERASGDVIGFVLLHAPEDAQRFIRAHREEIDVKYMDYDWSLNDR